jgi:hypothetical protein
MAGSWLDGGGSGHAVDVHELVDAQVTHGILQMVEAGALVSMGTTSDGGALGITVTVDGEWRREYLRTNDEAMAYLAEAVPAITDLLAGGRPSAASRQRPRRRKSA